MKKSTSSPKPKKTKQSTNMDFSSAIKEIIAGKKVHKLDWEDKKFYGFLNGEFLSLHKPDGKNYKWIITEGDLIGTDYIII